MLRPAAPHDPDVASGRRTVVGTAVRDQPGSPTVGREARHTLQGRRHVVDVVATVVLLVLSAVESVAAVGGIVFLSMAFHSCSAPGNACDVGLGGAVVYAGPVVVALVFVTVTVACVLRLVRRRWAWPVALVGIAAQVVVFSGALLLVDSAVQHGV